MSLAGVGEDCARIEPDTTQLGFMAFELGAGEYAFCIHDLRMLDVNGNAVSG